MVKKTTVNSYNNESITSLKGADRVRLRPGVIFGSDGIDGCQHSVFEIVSNSIDEAREGYGKKIEITLFKDKSIEVRDYGRGMPVDFNNKENRFNWELIFCELYAGGKYKNNSGENYEFSLGLNGLGTCATQYSSEYMDAVIYRDGFKYSLHFEKGENIGGLSKEASNIKSTGTDIKWRPDLDVFTDINISAEYFHDMLKKQAIVNAGLEFIFKDENTGEKTSFKYENGIKDYANELDNGKGITNICYFENETKGYNDSNVVQPFNNGNDYMQHVNKNDVIKDDSKYYLDEILEKCKEFNTEVIVVTVPNGKGWNQSKHNYLTSYCETKGLPFIDFNMLLDNIHFDWQTDTRDGGEHLNNSGSVKVMEYLSKYLHDNYQLKDKHDNTDFQAWNELFERDK